MYFLWRYRKVRRVLIILIIIAFPITLFKYNKEFLDTFDHYINPIIALGTVLLSIFIYFEQLSLRYLQVLPKRVSVHFLWKGKYIASCLEAPLAHESDLRNWAQQIGKQIFKGNLNMYPYNDIIIPKHPTKSQIGSKKGNTILHYTVKVHLNGKNLEDVSYNTEKLDFIENEQHVVWYDNESDTPDNKILYGNGFPRNITDLCTEINDRNSYKDKPTFSGNSNKEESYLSEIIAINKKMNDLTDEDSLAKEILMNKKDILNSKLTELIKSQETEKTLKEK